MTQIAASGDDTYALKSDGTLWAWEDNAYGQIGHTAAGHTQNPPIQVALTAVKSVGAGGTAGFATRSPGGQIALDAIAVVPGLGAFGADVKAGVWAERGASLAFANIGKAKW